MSRHASLAMPTPNTIQPWNIDAYKMAGPSRVTVPASTTDAASRHGRFQALAAGPRAAAAPGLRRLRQFPGRAPTTATSFRECPNPEQGATREPGRTLPKSFIFNQLRVECYLPLIASVLSVRRCAQWILSAISFCARLVAFLNAAVAAGWAGMPLCLQLTEDCPRRLSENEIKAITRLVVRLLCRQQIQQLSAVDECRLDSSKTVMSSSSSDTTKTKIHIVLLLSAESIWAYSRHQGASWTCVAGLAIWS